MMGEAANQVPPFESLVPNRVPLHLPYNNGWNISNGKSIFKARVSTGSGGVKVCAHVRACASGMVRGP